MLPVILPDIPWLWTGAYWLDRPWGHGGQSTINLTVKKEGNMKKNLGMVDRVIRFVLVIVLLILYLTGVISGVAAIVLGVLALIILVTRFVGFCPLFFLFKSSTRKD